MLLLDAAESVTQSNFRPRNQDSGQSAAVKRLSPDSLIVLTTNQCTATCGHCCMNSSAKRTERLDIGLMLETIEKFFHLYKIRVVVFAGGEPTLLKGNLLRAISKCRELGIVSRIVTNASWAINDAKAEAGFGALFRAGLTEVNISCDDYHSPFIPFDRVKTAWRAARKFPFGAIIIANASHKSSHLTPEYIRTEIGEDIPLRYDEFGVDQTFQKPRKQTVLGISNASTQRLGRGEDVFSDVDLYTSPQDLVLSQSCPNAVKMPAITPEGSLVACCGFELTGNSVLDFGSLTKKDVADLIENANKNVLVQIISRLGPGFLVKFVNQIHPGLIPTKEYVGICEACHDVVTKDEVLEVIFKNRGRLAAVLERLDSAASEGQSVSL